MEEKTNKSKIIIIVFSLIIVGLIVGVVILLNNRKLTPDEQVKKPDNSGEVTQNYDVNIEYDLNFDFLKMEYDKKNIVYSPLSIKLGLGLLREGADGDTLDQFNKVLDNNIYKVSYVDKKIGISNAVFLQKDLKKEVLDSYFKSLDSKYSAEILYDDFVSIDKVNDYVKEKTFDMIPKLFNNLQSDLVLVNALAIDLDWSYPFDESNSHYDKFYGVKEKNARYMSDTFKNNKNIKYYQDDKLSMVSLPLKNVNEANLEYIVIMPDNLDDYVSKLTLSSYSSDIDKLVSADKKNIKVLMPKFKFNYTLNFESDLVKLGLTDMFDSNKANFDRIIPGGGLYIDEAVHKAVIEVSETGVKAAAATGFSTKNSVAIEDEYDALIKIDKPFIVIIRDKDTKDIWFVSSVYDPVAGDEDES